MTSSITRFNALMSEIGATYHEISKRRDLTDSAFNIMYVVYDNEGSYPLSGIVKMTCISKQTVNSSLRNLESEGLVYLEKTSGRSKTVHLTEEGSRFAERTVKIIRDEENAVFDRWSEEERKIYFELTERYIEEMKKVAERL